MTKYTCHGVTRGGSRCARTVDNSGFCKDHPFDNGLVTKTGFAKLQGVDPSRVSQWIKNWTIQADDDGFIEWAKAEKAILASRDISKPLQRQGEQHDDAIVDEGRLDAKEVQRQYNLANMKKKVEEARREEIARLEDEGRLVPLEEVEADALDVAERLKAQLMAIPDRAAPTIAGMSEIREIHKYLTEEIRKALGEMSSDFCVMDGDAA